MVKNNYEILTITQPRSAYAEAFRRLQLNIQYASVDKPYKVIQVISSKPAEGKTTSSLNLAAVYAEKKKKVVVVDLDLRNPKVHRAFKLNVKDIPGVTQYILGVSKLEDIIHHDESGIDVITRGEKISFPETVLESKALAELIESLKEIYDYVILDCPPALVVTDPIIISKYADCQVLVAKYKQTKKAELAETVRMFKRSKGNIVGIILTNAKKQSSTYNGRYYGYYSYESYEYGQGGE